MASNPITKRDQIIMDMRTLILSGELARGTKLPQDHLAKRFDSSITPVREALRVLESENLVVSEPHRGVRVAGISFERIKATYIVRRLLEGYAIRRAATRLSPHDLRQVEQILDRLNEATLRQDSENIRLLNHQFHFFFYERCGIPALSDEIENLWRAFPWDMMLSAPEPSHTSELEHAAILDAIRAGDPDRAAEALDTHLARSFADLAERITGGACPDPFDIDND